MPPQFMISQRMAGKVGVSPPRRPTSSNDIQSIMPTAIDNKAKPINF
jgi:hypothetical protein